MARPFGNHIGNSAVRGVSKRLLTRTVFLVLLLAAWWYLADPSRVSPLILPAPSKVFHELPTLLASRSFYVGLRITVIEIGLAFLLSVSVGIIVGSLVQSSKHWSEVLRPLIVWGQTIPIILLYPVCLLLFGEGMASKVVFAGIYGAFPALLSTMTGFSSCPETLRTMGRAFGASRADIRFKVEFRMAWPMIVSGLRLAAALNMIGVLAGQMLGATAGLGYNIVSAEGSFLTDQVYGYILVVIVLVFSFNKLITVFEKLLLGRTRIHKAVARVISSRPLGTPPWVSLGASSDIQNM